jgi:hypothetical protein
MKEVSTCGGNEAGLPRSWGATDTARGVITTAASTGIASTVAAAIGAPTVSGISIKAFSLCIKRTLLIFP